MNSDKRYCFSCMEELVGHEHQVCPRCGHDNHIRINGSGLLSDCLLHGQYLTGKCLGRGGFGATYIGRDIVLDRVVAIKEYLPRETTTRHPNTASVQPLSASLAEDFEKGRASALHEARTMLDLGAMPKVVRLFNTFLENNTVYIVMEYIPGETLGRYIEKYERKRLPWAEVYRLMGSLLPVLHAIHQRGIIHRDISPDNIMIRSDNGEAVLLDFGISQAIKDGGKKATSSATATLRSGYAPIEQYSINSQQDARTDEYAYCATMYYALTGVVPPDATDFVAYNEVLTPPSRLGSDIPPKQEKVLLKGMSLKSDDRFFDMKQLEKAFSTDNEEAKKNPKTMSNGQWKLAVSAVCAAIVLCTGLFVVKPMIDETGSSGIQINQKKLEKALSAFTYTQDDGGITITGMLQNDAVVRVPEGVTAIDAGAFRNRVGLTSITLPETLKRIEENSFMGCDQLTSITIPDTFKEKVYIGGLTERTTIIGNHENPFVLYLMDEFGAKLDDTNRKPIPTVVPENTLTRRSAMDEAQIWDMRFFTYNEDEYTLTVTGIRDDFKKRGEIEVPQGVTHIGDRAFCVQTEFQEDSALGFGITYYNNDLSKLTLPQTLVSIGDYAFNNCYLLLAVELPENVTNIGEYAFSGCKRLFSVTLPKGITFIRKGTFDECISLEAISLPEGVYYIGENAFYNCKSLKSITIPDSAVAMDASAFSGCNLETIYGSSNNPVVLKLMDMFPGANLLRPEK